MMDAALSINPIEKWLHARRKTLDEWKRTPPHGLGLLVLLAVALEFVLAYRLFHGLSFDRWVVGSTINTAVFIAATEAGILLISNSVASVFNKRGRALSTFTTMNVALMPFLLFLPATLFFWATQMGATARLVVLLMLAVKVLSDWKEVVRVNYGLTGLQTYMLGGVVGGVGYAVLILFMVLSGFGVLVDSFSTIGLR